MRGANVVRRRSVTNPGQPTGAVSGGQADGGGPGLLAGGNGPGDDPGVPAAAGKDTELRLSPLSPVRATSGPQSIPSAPQSLPSVTPEAASMVQATHPHPRKPASARS